MKKVIQLIRVATHNQKKRTKQAECNAEAALHIKVLGGTTTILGHGGDIPSLAINLASQEDVP